MPEVKTGAGSADSNKSSYKDSLLNDTEDVPTEDWFEMPDEPENNWYKEPSNEEDADDSFDPCPEIKVTPEEFEEWCRPLRGCLVVQLLGKRVSLIFMAMKLRQKWGRKGDVRVIDLPQDYFLVQFVSQEDYTLALYEGPWMVAAYYLVVQRLRPFFIENAKEIRKVAVWVRILDLTWELCNKNFLWRAGACLGTMLKVDMATSIHSRGKFARLCVEINLRKRLVPKLRYMGRELTIEYGGLHQIVFLMGGMVTGRTSARRTETAALLSTTSRTDLRQSFRHHKRCRMRRRWPLLALVEMRQLRGWFQSQKCRMLQLSPRSQIRRLRG